MVKLGLKNHKTNRKIVTPSKDNGSAILFFLLIRSTNDIRSMGAKEIIRNLFRRATRFRFIRFKEHNESKAKN